METLSARSVSALKVHGLHSTSRELCHFKTTPSTSSATKPHLYCSATNPSFISNKTAASFISTPIFLSPSSPTLSSLASSSPNLHRKPATGYAAALLDTAQRKGCTILVEKDVQGFLKSLRNKQVQDVLADPLMAEKDKGQVVMEVVKKGVFGRHLVGLVMMLARNNKASLVKEVLEEFERIYNELCGTRVVLVSSAERLGKDQLCGIAKRVQGLTGAVKVKVRNLVHENSPSYAV